MGGRVIPPDVAVRLQFAMIAGNEPAPSFIEIRPLAPAGRQVFVPVRDLDAAVAAVERLTGRHDVYAGAAPRTSPSGRAEAVERVWCLWADCDSPEAVERLKAFRPLPNIVIRSGTEGHLHAWWQLAKPLAPAHAVRANRRLARAVGADTAATDAARVMRLAGTVNRKHTPPTLVACVHLELDCNSIADIVRGLPDDPRYTAGPSRPSRASKHDLEPSRVLGALVRFVSESPVGERNERLNWAAYRAAEREIEPIKAESALLTAALEAGLGEHEARRTIASGFNAAGRRGV
jgi:hypothetical protein